MGLLKTFIDFIIHLDKNLALIIQGFGIWTYLLLFLAVFAETGLVVAPFLPGDSLLFAAGTFAAVGSFNVMLLFAILCCASIAGDNLNYFVGRFAGKKIAKSKNKFVKKEYIDKTHKFYAKYGAKTVVIARFMPIVRTFSPFVAGIGKMKYIKFLAYSIIGALLWVGLFVFGGYFFGNIPVIRNNFSITIMIIIILSITPAVIGYWRHKQQK